MIFGAPVAIQSDGSGFSTMTRSCNVTLNGTLIDSRMSGRRVEYGGEKMAEKDGVHRGESNIKRLVVSVDILLIYMGWKIVVTAQGHTK